MTELKEIYDKIKEEYKDIEVTYEELEKLEQKKDKTDFVETLQEICNDIYTKNGFNDNILDIQVYINQLRAEYDITDPREVIHEDNGKGFVQ